MKLHENLIELDDRRERRLFRQPEGSIPIAEVDRQAGIVMDELAERYDRLECMAATIAVTGWGCGIGLRSLNRKVELFTEVAGAILVPQVDAFLQEQ